MNDTVVWLAVFEILEENDFRVKIKIYIWILNDYRTKKKIDIIRITKIIHPDSQTFSRINQMTNLEIFCMYYFIF